MILWKNIFVNQIISNLTTDAVTSSFLVVFCFPFAVIYCSRHSMFVKRNNDLKTRGGALWSIATAVNKQKLWASTQGAKYTNLIRLAPTTSTLSFPLLTMIWWHSTLRKSSSAFCLCILPSVQFSSVAQSCLTLCNPSKSSYLWVLSLTRFPQLLGCTGPSIFPLHDSLMACNASLSSQVVNIINSVSLNLFLFSSCNHTWLTISWKMQNTLKWFHKMLIYCTQWYNKSRLTLAWNHDWSQASWRP